MDSDRKLVQTILERLSSRLPIRTGDDLRDVRRDEVVALSRSTLIEMSKAQINVVVSGIIDQLEHATRAYDTINSRNRSQLVLLSQTYLVELLADCLGSHWEAIDRERGVHVEPPPVTTAFVPRRSRRRSTDPPPLDDTSAKYTVELLLRLTATAYYDDHGSIGSGKINGGDEKSLDGLPRKASDLERAAFKVIEYVSASNWGLVYQIMKTKLKYLRTTAADDGDATGLQFIAHLSLSQKKLSLVIQEISGSFLPLRKAAQNTLAALLPEAIHRWIDSHPSDFIDLHTSQQRIEGGADVLFDFATGLTDSAKRRAVIWPLQTALVLLLPEVFVQADMTGGPRGSSLAKKLIFLNNLRQALRLPKSADIAASCLITICRAGSLFPADSDSALLSFAYDIQNDMREEIFKRSLHNHSLDDYGIDRDILIKAFVCLARLSVESVVEHLVPKCLDKSSPMSFKITVFAAAAVLGSQTNNAQYQPLFDAIAPALRSYLNSIASTRKTTVSGNMPIGMVEQIPVEKLRQGSVSTDSIGSIELLYQILELLKIRPFLLYENWDAWDKVMPSNTSAMDQSISDKSIYAVLKLIYDEDEFVRTGAVIFARRLMSPESYEWVMSLPNHKEKEPFLMSLFWLTTSAILFTLSQRLLDFRFHDPGLKGLLELLHSYLETRVNMIQTRRELSTGAADVSERAQANISLEKAFLVLLCSADLEICSMTTHAIALLCEEGRMVENPEEHGRSNLTLMRNFPVYSELSLQAFRITGPVAFQKRLRKLLARMANPSPGILSAWEAVFTRWRLLCHHILSPGVAASGRLDDRIQMEWRNYSGFLASIAGCCIADLPTHMAPLRITDASMVGAHWIDRVQSENEPMSLLEQFMKQCLQLLVCKLVSVRESIREVLGTELNPRLYLQLFRSVDSELNSILDPLKESPSETRTLFTEQISSLLKTIVERLEEAQDTFMEIDLGAMTLSLARYLATLRDEYTTLRVKIRMCNLVELVASKKQILSLRNDIKLRNSLVQILTEWMSFSAKSGGEMPASGYKRDEYIRLQRDLDRACLRALVNLLNRLPLQPPESSHDADIVDARSQTFCNYFNSFLSLLDSSGIVEGGDNTRRGKDAQTASLARDDAVAFQSLAIQALSNMLSANVDVGLKLALEIGYHDSLTTRTAFMQVLTNILTQGTEFGTLGDSAIGEKYEELIDLLVHDLNFALALCDCCPSSEVDELTVALLNIFDSRGKGLVLLKELIQQEVAKTDNESELLRRNCVATKMLSVFAKWKGAEYLQHVLQDKLERLVASSSDLDLEMDSKRGGLTDIELERNGEALRYIAKAFITEITQSAPNVPDSFRRICHTILSCVTSKFPEAKYTAVGAFIFLRFFCPAIVSPDTEGLINSVPSKEMRRGLMLIAKIIQNLANNVLFGAKESYMIPLNPFLTEHISDIIRYLREISAPPKKREQAIPPDSFDFGSRVALHRFLYDHWENVRHKLIFQEKARLQRSNGEAVKSFSELPPSVLQQSVNSFSALISTLGPPPLDISLGRPQMTGAIPANYSRYQRFMLRNSGRSVESIVSAKIVYEGGETNDGMPVVCFVQRNVHVDSIDPDLLTYCYLKLLTRLMHKPFAVLVDATCHSLSNELADDVCLKISSLMPPEMIKNYRRLYVYNMNSAYRKFFRRTLRSAVKDENNQWNPANLDFIIIGSIQELQQHFNLGSLHLPKETMSFLSDSRYVFHNVTRLSKTKGKTDVVFKVGSQYIQITPVRKQELYPGYKMMVTVNDIFRLADVEEANASFHTDEENAFGIKTDNGKVSMFFSSPKKNEILKVLKTSKAKNTKDNKQTTKSSERTIRPEDVPGTMLNISLMNMASTDPDLRLAAYNLLCAMSETFQFTLDRQSVNARGLSIPPDAVTLIVGVSERLAATEPQLTSDFLTEFFIGWDKTHPHQRPLNIRYMGPWISNLYAHVLMNSDDPEKGRERLAVIARKVIDITVAEPRLYASFQQNCWSIIGKDEALLDVFLEELVRAAMNFGFGSEGAEVIGSICSSFETLTIRSKVITRLRKALNRSSLRATRHLVDNPVWNEICVLLKICLAISFDSRVQAQLFLPELFHVITMVVNCGSPQVRSTVHSLLVNSVHSIATSFPLEDASLAKLKGILNSLNEPKMCLLFSLNRPTSRDAPAQEQRALENTPNTTMEQITNLLLEIIEVAAPAIDMANIWRARWMSLVASTAFQSNPAIQPRAFAVMGCLAREDVDDDLLYQVLVVLRNALARFVDSGDHEMLTSIINSVTKMMDNLSPASRYLHQLFWVAVALVRLGSGVVFNCSAALLESTLRTLSACGEFKDNRMVTVLIQGKNSIGQAASVIDELYGIRFDADNFHFALAATLTKGLQSPSTKPSAIKTLTAFVEVGTANSTESAQWTIDNPLPPYLSLVVSRTTNPSEIKELLWMVGLAVEGEIEEKEIWSHIPPLEALTERNLLLSGVLAIVDFRCCEESIQKHSLGFFTHMAKRRPEVLLILYDHLLENIESVLSSSHSTLLLKEANDLMRAVSSIPIFSNRRDQREKLDAFLLGAGLEGMWISTTFKACQDREATCAGLTDKLIETIIM